MFRSRRTGGDRRQMETGHRPVSDAGYEALRGAAKVDARCDAEDAHPATSRIGTRRHRRPEGLSSSPPEGGILAHGARSDSPLRIARIVQMGRETLGES